MMAKAVVVGHRARELGVQGRELMNEKLYNEKADRFISEILNEMRDKTDEHKSTH